MYDTGIEELAGSMRAFWKSPLFIALAIGLLTVMSRDARDLEHIPQSMWFWADNHQVETGATIVSLDGGGRLSNQPITSTGEEAELVRSILRSGAKHVYLDFPRGVSRDLSGDERLREEIAAAGNRLTMVNRGRVVGSPEVRTELVEPRFAVPDGTQIAVSSWTLNATMTALSTESTVLVGDHKLPVVALDLAKKEHSGTIYLDPTVAVESVPTVDGRDVLSGQVSVPAFKNRNVFITATGFTSDSTVGYFGAGKIPMAVADISAAWALEHGKGKAIAWPALFIVFVVGAMAGRQIRHGLSKVAYYSAFACGLSLGPLFLRSHGYVTEFGGVWVTVAAYALARGWQKWRDRVRTTATGSGLPNIEALSSEGIPPGCDVVAVSVSHYEQMLASLPRELHAECARQIARRLSVAASGSRVFDNDNGHFVWLVQPYALDALTAQFEGLKALFSAPLVIGGHILDTNVYFGLDRNSTREPLVRIRSAIVSANEAQSKGKLYEEFGQQRLAEAPWELSLNARIDEALRNGDIWLAFQAQYDIRHDRIGGAETLIRWTDPERGAIPPDSFIIQAERAGRIDAITYWVLERAIQASHDLAAIGHGELDLAVNLSAWMVDQPGLVSHVTEIIRQSGFDCRRLTFEVTETFSMTNRELAKRNLGELRAMGCRLSIDDFGTGWASLSYLSEIATDEIKLDKRFVQALCHSRRDRAIVSSTIQLARSLGQVIVAEGVEDIPTLRALQELGCDIAQGYLIGRPVRFNEFVQTLSIAPYRSQLAI